MQILSQRDLVPFAYFLTAKDDNGNTLAQSRAIADTTCSENNFAGRPSQTYKHQVRMLLFGAGNRISLISCNGHTITIRLQQLFNAIAGFVNILHHQYE